MPSLSMPPGSLGMLILRVLHNGPLHGYAIAQRIHQLSGEVHEFLLQESWIKAYRAAGEFLARKLKPE